ncbi:hypothetical protein NDU88_005820 [Pleurodeles waltl]|uniref:Uncharacterized protein n=1 Tax=Pleurodeles waltl TaxID=8319 RepID=A0AAV7NNK1_PLEWA|nr:hypothetical protein NDU88_005820 [Pleurodeles waltl]
MPYRFIDLLKIGPDSPSYTFQPATVDVLRALKKVYDRSVHKAPKLASTRLLAGQKYLFIISLFGYCRTCIK